MSKYTPGPWILDCEEDHADVIADDYHFIDGGIGFTGGSEPGFGLSGLMSPADARLIASAPELLEALIALHAVASVERDEDYAAVTNAAAIIAKATAACPPDKDPLSRTYVREE